MINAATVVYKKIRVAYSQAYSRVYWKAYSQAYSRGYWRASEAARKATTEARND